MHLEATRVYHFDGHNSSTSATSTDTTGMAAALFTLGKRPLNDSFDAFLWSTGKQVAKGSMPTRDAVDRRSTSICTGAHARAGPHVRARAVLHFRPIL